MTDYDKEHSSCCGTFVSLEIFTKSQAYIGYVVRRGEPTWSWPANLCRILRPGVTAKDWGVVLGPPRAMQWGHTPAVCLSARRREVWAAVPSVASGELWASPEASKGSSIPNVWLTYSHILALNYWCLQQWVKDFTPCHSHFGGVKDLTLSKEGLGMVARVFNLRDRRIWVQGQSGLCWVLVSKKVGKEPVIGLMECLPIMHKALLHP